jgi:hypothetical protein
VIPFNDLENEESEEDSGDEDSGEELYLDLVKERDKSKKYDFTILS